MVAVVDAADGLGLEGVDGPEEDQAAAGLPERLAVLGRHPEMPKLSSRRWVFTPARHRSAIASTSPRATGPSSNQYVANVMLRRAARIASTWAGKIASPLSRMSTRLPPTIGEPL